MTIIIILASAFILFFVIVTYFVLLYFEDEYEKEKARQDRYMLEDYDPTAFNNEDLQ